MNFKERISIQFTNLTKTDKKITNILLKHPEYLIEHSAQEAAELMETSPAALVRLAKKIGHKGLADFKISLEDYAKHEPREDVYLEKPLLTKVIDNYRKNLHLLEMQLDEEQLERIAEILAKAPQIKILGIGSSGLVAEHMVYFLLYQDKYTESVTSKTKMYYLSRSLTAEDVLLIYSVSGNKDYEELFAAVKEAGAQLIVVTMNDHADIKKIAAEFVLLPSNLTNLGSSSGEIYQLDNRSLFLVFSEILAAYIHKKLK
ncbi:MurR/RpiR family transcriptional regulator [Streptococcus pantholopis]|uniref:RpiR family transcriptional regulator n=1 Tax=Streptococcus pantholopis TaxID=1811193 RepID=A0A172QA68_9STRE|nr:MurR/RpiR family transcriptional regulator [Streptococcus pantholopis]AND80379.1 RpiR family transcriptional regulator [Streptococcus pantholopis]